MTVPTDGPSAQSEYYNWFSEPAGRGTYSIIFSCLSTLLFCSSKVFKPNILPAGWRGRAMLFSQIIAGMFVPEVVYLMALGQFFDAKGVRDTVNAKAEKLARSVRGELDSPRPEMTIWQYLTVKEQSPHIQLDLPGCKFFERWTLVHGFYAIMGGFEVNASRTSDDHPERLRIRPHVLINMATEGRFRELNIAEDELEDKSNFDSLGNIIAFIQALWLCVQSIARVQQQLAITLLEVSTMAHVVISTFILILWWRKPQSIRRGHVIINQPTLPEIEVLVRYEKIRRQYDPISLEKTHRKEHYMLSNNLKKTTATARHSDRFFRRSAMREARAESSFLQESPDTLWMFHIEQSRALRDTWFDQSLYYWSTAAYWGVVAVYGAVHVAAWHTYFPTPIERTLWLIASLVIASVASLYGVGALAVFWCGPQRWKDLVPSPNGTPVRFAHILGCLAIGGHIYIFLESWASLRSLPLSASATVDWLRFLPHTV